MWLTKYIILDINSSKILKMKKTKQLIISIFMIINYCFTVNAQLPAEVKDFKLVWSDNFKYPNSQLEQNWVSANDKKKPGHILSSRHRSNLVVRNNKLELLYKKESKVSGSNWTAGTVWSKREFQYGYFECRYKYANAKGTNDSFWLMTRDFSKIKSGRGFELDINEGHSPHEVNTNIHKFDKGFKNRSVDPKVHLFNNINFATSYNVFGFKWDAKEFVWFLNGKEIRREKNTHAYSPTPVRLSSAVITWDGPVTNAINGKKMIVDYVRVYKKGTGGNNGGSALTCANAPTWVKGRSYPVGSRFISPTDKRLYEIQPGGKWKYIAQCNTSGGGNNGGNAGGGNNSGIPFNKEIAIRKFSGNKHFLQVNPNTGAQLASTGGANAPTQAWQTWERFVVKAHPKGGVALYSLANNKYLQVNGNNKNAPIVANGPNKNSAPLSWERFEWRSRGGNNFSLRSYQFGNNKAWLWCRPENNAKVEVKGAAPGNWEMFTYQVVSNNARKQLNTISSDFKVSTVNSKGSLEINIEGGGDISVDVYSISGQNVYSEALNTEALSTTIRLEEGSLSSGVYIAKISVEGNTKTVKFSI